MPKQDGCHMFVSNMWHPFFPATHILSLVCCHSYIVTRILSLVCCHSYVVIRALSLVCCISYVDIYNIMLSLIRWYSWFVTRIIVARLSSLVCCHSYVVTRMLSLVCCHSYVVTRMLSLVCLHSYLVLCLHVTRHSSKSLLCSLHYPHPLLHMLPMVGRFDNLIGDEVRE